MRIDQVAESHSTGLSQCAQRLDPGADEVFVGF